MQPQRTANDYKSDLKPVWCPGCGDFGVLKGVYEAMLNLQLDPDKVAIVSGIGCSGRLPYFTKCYSFHGVHGRSLPTAMGIKLANPELTVLAVGGDGDGFAIGGGHIPHMARKNIDITYIVMDNEIYGLTKGQVAPTSPLNQSYSTAPFGNLESGIDPVALVLSYGATYVARGFSGDPGMLTELIQKGIEHKGFSFVHVLSPCPTFNKAVTFKSIRSKAQAVNGHNPTDLRKALDLALDSNAIHLGVFYQVEKKSYNERWQEIWRETSQKPGNLEDLLQRYA
jgi:2-oxoglutarate ferredoxin oxidoreductase subunit beta